MIDPPIPVHSQDRFSFSKIVDVERALILEKESISEEKEIGMVVCQQQTQKSWQNEGRIRVGFEFWFWRKKRQGTDPKKGLDGPKSRRFAADFYNLLKVHRHEEVAIFFDCPVGVRRLVNGSTLLLP